MSDAAYQAADAAIDQVSESLRELSLDIHAHPEENYEEVHAHAALTSWLREAEFDVAPGAYGMATAFAAEQQVGSGGPTIAVLSEYDALPGIGHACGHNLIAISGVAAAVGLAAALRASGGAGRVRLLGSPAEEGGGGKIRLIQEGAFNDVGAAMMIHPGTADMLRPRVLAIDTCKVEFRGRNAHAAAAPWEGRNALDALVLAYQAIGLLRQQSQPGVRMHGVIDHGGEKPNIIPDRASAEFYVRAPQESLLDEMCGRVEQCFQGAAQAAECEVEIRWLGTRYSDLATNDPLADAFGRHWRDLGTEAADLDGRGRGGFGSTDMGDVSHVVPSIHPMYAIPCESGNHTADFTSAAAAPEAHEVTLTASRAMVRAGFDWLSDAELRERAQSAFDQAHAR